jgi:hypothetical protein
VPKEDENEAIEKEVMSCGNLLNHGDILLHQSQIEFNICDLGGGKFKEYLETNKMTIRTCSVDLDH